MKPAFGGACHLAIASSVTHCVRLPRLSPGGQAHYSDMAIETALMLRLTFHLPLRQTEGFMESIFALLGMTVSAPDHSTLSRRATTLPSVSLGRIPDGPLHVLIDSTGLKVYGAGNCPGWVDGL